MAINPTGMVLYVTGDSHAAHWGGSYTTVAYRASTGARLWANRYTGAGGPAAIAVNPRGAGVFVTGTRNFEPGTFDLQCVGPTTPPPEPGPGWTATAPKAAE